MKLSKVLTNTILGKFLSSNPEPGSLKQIKELPELTTNELIIEKCQEFVSITESILPVLKKLEALEEVIMQMLAMEVMDEVKLNIVRGEYIYARSLFFRKYHGAKDIRVIIGKTDMLENNKLPDDPSHEIYKIGKIELKNRMREILTSNLHKLKDMEITKPATNS